MIGSHERLVDELRRRISETRGSVPFASFIAEHPVGGDDELAELIEADGRARLALGAEVDLRAYLAAASDLAERPAALDAAIDVSLRSLSRDGSSDVDAAARLAEEYPDLRREIREAALLNRFLCTTGSLQHRFVGRLPERDLPCDFGPQTPSGQLRYELRERLGAGASGVVYRAADRALGDHDKPAIVAIKVLREQGEGAWARERMIEEAAKARRVDDPGVVRVLDRGVSERGEDFIVYEHVPGGTLLTWLERHGGRIAARDAASIVARLARGVQAAHSAGLVHCDIKPTNVVMAADGAPRLADFGVAVRAGEPMAASAEAGDGKRPIGNLAFMAPEQFRMEDGALSPPADIYALGGLLYWLLTGRTPNGETFEEIARRHDSAGAEPPSARRSRPDVDRTLDAICARALAPRRSDRYAAAGMMSDDLEAWLRHEPIAWRRPSQIRVLALWARRKPLAAALAGALCLSVVGGAAVAQRLDATARERAYEAQIASVRFEESQKRDAKATAVIAGFAARLRADARKGDATAALSAMWVMEWLTAPGALGDPTTARVVRVGRIGIVREAIDHGRKVNGGDTVETLFLESSLGFWLLRDGEAAEAESVLAQNEQGWRSLLARPDPWIESVVALRTAAAARSMAQAAAATPPDAEQRAAAAQVAQTLRAMQERHAPRLEAGPLRLVMLECLADLYDSPLLNDAAGKKWAIDTAKSLNVSYGPR